MVHHLVSALSTLPDSVIDVEASAEHSVLIRIGTAIKTPRVVSPIQSSRRQYFFSNNTSSSVASPSADPRSMPSRVLNSIRSSIITLMSPQRRKANASLSENTTYIPTIESSSPRNGSDNKRFRCNEVRQAITDNPVWGRCTLPEFAQFSVGDQFIIIIPSDHKQDSKHAITQRRSVRDRIVAAVAMSSLDDSDATINKAPHRRLSNTVRQQNAHDDITNNHGIERNKKIYFELRCAIHRYPHHDDFINNTMGSKDIDLLFRQNEGVFFSLLDYHQQVIHIR